MVYLNKLESELLSKASDRELSLYRFLEGRTHTFVPHENDKAGLLCSLSFGENGGQRELQKLRSDKPVKGMHYSNNMTVLIAAANIDRDNELENLGSYVESHSYRDLFIINKALDSNFSKSINDALGVDLLAKKLMLDDQLREEDIANSLTKVDDLYDFFVLRTAVARLAHISEKELGLPNYQELYNLTVKFSSRLDSLSLSILLLTFLIIAYYTVPPFVSYIVENWDTLEPIAWLLGLAVALLAALGFVLSEKVKKVYIRTKQLSLRAGYWLFGIDYRKFTSLLEDLKKCKTDLCVK